MKLGYCVQNFSEKPLEEVVRLVVEKGYEAVEIATYDGNGQCDAGEMLKNGNGRAMRKMVESHGIFISALSNHADSLLILGPHSEDTDGIYKGTKEEKIKFGTESLLQSARLANELEISVVIGFTGVENFGRYFPFPYAKGWEACENQFVERFMPILDKFKEYGVKFAVEPHPNNLIYDIHTASRCVELVDGHPCLGFNLDPANLIYLAPNIVEHFIDELGDRIFAVHAKDAEIVAHNLDRGGILMQGAWQSLDRAFRFRIPGWGNVNWKRVITELAMVGYNGVLSYEHEDVTMSRNDGLDKVMDFLKPLLIHAPYEGRQDKLFTK